MNKVVVVIDAKKEKKKPGRKPANGIAAQTNAQRKQRQLERQLNRIAELPHTEWEKAECLLILQRTELEYLVSLALMRLCSLYGFNVGIIEPHIDAQPSFMDRILDSIF